MGEPVRSLSMTEKLYADTALAQRVITCFVEATSVFIAGGVAERHEGIHAG